MLLGGLYGFLALALHSFTDFGVHMPAVAVLAVVHTACLMGAADSRRPAPAPRAPLARLAVAAGLVAAGALVGWDRWTADRADQSRAAARGLEGDRPLTAAQADRAVRLLAAACEARPDSALYRHELGQGPPGPRPDPPARLGRARPPSGRLCGTGGRRATSPP